MRRADWTWNWCTKAKKPSNGSVQFHIKDSKFCVGSYITSQPMFGHKCWIWFNYVWWICTTTSTTTIAITYNLLYWDTDSLVLFDTTWHHIRVQLTEQTTSYQPEPIRPELQDNTNNKCSVSSKTECTNEWWHNSDHETRMSIQLTARHEMNAKRWKSKSKQTSARCIQSGGKDEIKHESYVNVNWKQWSTQKHMLWATDAWTT